MATVAETIRTAYRESNLIAITAEPTEPQQTEGLDLLEGVFLSVFGFEVGRELTDINIGGLYDQSSCIPQYVPEDLRLVMESAGARTFELHPRPYNGQRLAVVDGTGTLSANPLTLEGNGRRIEGQSSITLNTDGERRQWFYRADLGEWVRITALALDDAMPFPRKYDQYFSTLLAMRLNPRYGQELQQSSAAWLENISTQLEADYRRPRPTQDWGSLGLLGQRRTIGGYSRSAFIAGRP